jgi:multimeric flavodoxin WrbA
LSKLLIIWWSRTGASEQLSIAAEEGALSCSATSTRQNVRHVVVEGTSPSVPPRVLRLRCDQVEPSHLLSHAAYLFVCPENLGSMAGMMKEFFDRCYYPLLEKIAGRPYACIVSAGSDGQGAARQIARIATGWRLNLVNEVLIVNLSAQTALQILAPKRVPEPELQRAFELGALLAQGLELGIF